MILDWWPKISPYCTTFSCLMRIGPFYASFLILVTFCFRYSLDEYGTARRTAVVRGLIDALTRGGEYWVHMVQIKVLKGFIVYAWQKYINFDSNVLSCMLLVQSKFLYHWFPVRVYNSRSLEYVL